MLIRFSTAAALAALVACAPAFAAPATVQLRVEGASSTIFEGSVTTDGKLMDKGGGPRPCDGTNLGVNPGPGPTMTSALDDASIAAGFPWQGTWFDGFEDFGIDQVGPDASDFVNNRYWGYALDFVPSAIGGCQQRVQGGDEVLFGYDFFSKSHLLKLTGATQAVVGQSAAVTVVDGQTGLPLSGASVGGRITRTDGQARVSFSSPGLQQLKAERADSIRSNTLLVCVAPAAGVDCGLPATQFGGGAQQEVRDSKAPATRISNPRNGARYGRGPRLLRGTTSDDQSGVGLVELALRRRVRGKGCSRWSGRRERLVRSNCRKVSFFEVGNDPSWSYLMPRRLPRGRYVLDVKASDRAGNREKRLVRGQTRVVFDVLR